MFFCNVSNMVKVGQYDICRIFLTERCCTIGYNGWRYGLVKADHYRPIEEQNFKQPLLTIPLVSVSFLSSGGTKYKIMISKETIKEATTFRKTMFWFGIVTLPIGLGLLFLLMWFNLKCAMDDYQRALENER